MGVHACGSLSLTGALDRDRPWARSSARFRLAVLLPHTHPLLAETELYGRVVRVSASCVCPASGALRGSCFASDPHLLPPRHTPPRYAWLEPSGTCTVAGRESRQSQVQTWASLCDPDESLDLELQLPNLRGGKSDTHLKRRGREKRCSLAGAWQGGRSTDVGSLFSIREGAHLNPAFSLTMCLLGQFPWFKLPIYSLVQIVGAFCAAGTTYIVYYGNRGRSVCSGAGGPRASAT